MNVKFQIFSPEEEIELYREYRHNKFIVFIEELGFTSLPCSPKERMANEDPYDKQGKLIVAKSNSTVIGIARGIKIRDDFPHKQIFLHHLMKAPLIDMQSSISTINAVAVIKKFRGVKIEYPGFSNKISIAKIMMVLLVNKLKELGAKIVLISTEANRTKIFFHKLGFYIIDRPFIYDFSPVSIVNMALIINDRERFLKINSPMLMNCKKSILDKNEEKVKNYFINLDAQYSKLSY